MNLTMSPWNGFRADWTLAAENKKMNFDPKDIKAAGRVCEFLERMSAEQRERWESVRPQCIPFGDLAYGTALADWYKNGCPKSAWFSTAEGEMECPYLMEFRKELTGEFGLRILTKEESKDEEKKHTRILATKVFDWGPN